jgi:hypothetical protein
MTMPTTEVKLALTEEEMMFLGYCIAAGMVRAHDQGMSQRNVDAIWSLHQKVHDSNPKFAALQLQPHAPDPTH